MKVNEVFAAELNNGTRENRAIIGLLNYAMGDVKSYDELTLGEKEIIDRDVFIHIFGEPDEDDGLTKNIIMNSIIAYPPEVIENFLKRIHFWDDDKRLCQFIGDNGENVRDIIKWANDLGHHNIKINIKDCDEYIYGYLKDDGSLVYVIEDMEASVDNLKKKLKLNKVADLILNNKEYKKLYYKTFES